jgi:hypothetical protein
MSGTMGGWTTCPNRWIASPNGIQSSPCPPVWVSFTSEICILGTGISPSLTARFMPRSAPPGVSDDRDARPYRCQHVPRSFVEAVRQGVWILRTRLGSV